MRRKLQLQAGLLLVLGLIVIPATAEEKLVYSVNYTDHAFDTVWNEFCSDVSNSFYKHPSICWEFVFCSQGTVTRYSCPIGEIWSQQDGACLPGSWETCELLNIETSCQGRLAGAVAYPTDCSRYLQCDNGKTTIVDCPRGQVFDQLAARCVAGNTETCMRMDSICQDQTNGTVLAHPNECDMFISCQGGSANAQQCPVGQILNVQAQYCTPGNADTCQFYPLNAMCQNAANFAVFPFPGDCTQFVLCSGGKSAAMKCPIGQILHAPSGSCRPGNTNTCEFIGDMCQDQPDGLMIAHPSLCEIYVMCQGGTVRIQSCPHHEILRRDAQFCVPGNSLTCEFDPLDKMCSGKIDSVNYPHPTECGMYVMCHAQKAIAQSCPSGSIYDAPTRSCIPGNETTCEQFEDICSGRADGIIPHPTKCTAFVYCSSGRPIFEQCAPGTVYKQGLSGCVVGNTETCTHATHICTDRPDGTVLDHPNECNLIVTCMMQLPAVMLCPAGEIYNSNAKFCTPGDSKTCQVHPVERMCGNARYGTVYPHPNDCTQYVRCNGGQPIVAACPAGLVLHARTGTCQPGDTNTCELLENLCQNQTDGLVLNHPSKCEHFIWCQRGAMSVRPCPTGEILHPDTKYCVPGDANSCEFQPVEQMCLKKSDSTRFPHPTECTQFVACQGQKSVVQSCPSGSVYHAPTRSCVPGNEATCERFDSICAGRPNGLIPHPLVCTGYIHCTSNTAVFEQCPKGTVFDRQLRSCILGNTKTCVRVDGLCEKQPDGAMLEHPNECDMYIMCIRQVPAPLRCPAGEILNVESQFCAPGKVDTCEFHPVDTMCQNIKDNTVYPHPEDCTRFIKCNSGKAAVNDCPVGEVVHGLTKSCKPGNTKTCKFVDRVCQGQPEGVIIAHPNLCGQFIKCRNGAVTILSCPNGEILHSESKRCVPGNTTTCEFESIERTCIGKPDGRLYPHPTDCHSYIRCASSVGVAENCRPGTIFKAATQSCVAGNENTCSFLDGMCAGRRDGIIPHPQGCDLFLMCTSGTTSALRCPEGEILHPESLVCAAGNADDCKLTPVITEPPIFSVCEGRPNGNYTNSQQCYSYIRCTNGSTEIVSCPSNQIFVGAIRSCAPGHQESCIPL